MFQKFNTYFWMAPYLYFNVLIKSHFWRCVIRQSYPSLISFFFLRAEFKVFSILMNWSCKILCKITSIYWADQSLLSYRHLSWKIQLFWKRFSQSGCAKHRSEMFTLTALCHQYLKDNFCCILFWGILPLWVK
jgi:hypothetical protein